VPQVCTIRDDLGLISPLEQLGMMYQNMGCNDKAESTFLHPLHLMEGHFGLSSRTLIDPLPKLATLYQVMGKTANEEQTQQRLRAIQTQPPR
jgi:uncharacterized protein YneF (UPF0154 family)